ncbi:PEGA domain-containing protein [Massilia sp. Dwa41.01b]|uniref:PEGA domain-containing protein n=1 Tax=unclassified Massilia TaxID=2609279 RepID=UPI0016039E09|nr:MULTISPECIES: PEGA domain-containing protein [unclassified Massilia]QNA87776.1 PEGA domain-containing protein [Massilia sp. Dwa41.01b]QNA98680.1 PEGA domain-containing protein [Massilia sp. Se16.2.3]
MNRFSSTIAIAATALALTGCASMHSGTTQQVKVSSNPAGATVYTAIKKDGVVSNKVAVGVTPLTVTLSRKHGALFVEKEGFVATEVQLTTRMNPWVWGDILLTSPLSTSIDTSTGAAREYDPGEFMVDLQPVAK